MRNLAKYSAAIVLLSSLALVGCSGNKEASLVGHYKADVTVPAGKENDLGTQMAKGMMLGTTLDLKADKTFAMTMMMFPIEGTWILADDKVTLTPTKVMGMSVDDAKKLNPSGSQSNSKPMIFNVGSDGKLTAEAEAGKTDTATANTGLSFVKDPK